MNVTTAQLPFDSHYSTGWVTRKIAIGEQVESIDYHNRTDSYVVGTSRNVDYKLPADEAWAAEGAYSGLLKHECH